MHTTEQVFKNGIEEHLDSILNVLGYNKSDEWKGFVKYTSKNNYLTFGFDWNRSYEFSCSLGFNQNSEFEFPINTVLAKLGKNHTKSELEFGTELPDRILEWIIDLQKDFQHFNLAEINYNSKIIEELERELTIEAEEYNRSLQFNQLKSIIDKAWEENKYELFIEKIENSLSDFPKSYAQKLSIAKKRVE
ncbi:hypothetical protein KO494_07800 [Lacinutrix sp. C3R15]|uniref:hypothetical protein n=1 Tax=Flavobacteriaceae TaxID=49546 RepID=UPI001C084093|nr:MULTISPECIES: hypothetical protein [Flavobacteriaceae]MBU2939442.1 hypothetical protein [Lacinutrix sp. C3R15]MDO6622757.1 hypothetical protein [Oceanihabitans sp. 1_MG-2023]